MENVTAHEETIFAWNCPKCGDYNSEDEDPQGQYVICEGCNETFVCDNVETIY